MAVTRQDKMRFSKKFEDYRRKKGIGSYITAFITFCEETGVELEVAASMINGPLKARIQEDAERLNLLKGKRNKLQL